MTSPSGNGWTSQYDKLIFSDDGLTYPSTQGTSHLLLFLPFNPFSSLPLFHPTQRPEENYSLFKVPKISTFKKNIYN